MWWIVNYILPRTQGLNKRAVTLLLSITPLLSLPSVPVRQRLGGIYTKHGDLGLSWVSGRAPWAVCGHRAPGLRLKAVWGLPGVVECNNLWTFARNKLGGKLPLRQRLKRGAVPCSLLATPPRNSGLFHKALSCQHLKETHREDAARLFTGACTDRTRGMGSN